MSVPIRRLVYVAVGGIVALVLAIALLRESESPRQSIDRPRAASSLQQTDGASPGPRGPSSEPPRDAAATTRPSFALRLIDVGLRASTAGVGLRVERAGDKPLQSVAADDGSIVVDGAGPVRLASTTPGWRLLFPAKSYDAAADVMVVRTASISCDVSFDDSPSTRPAVQVTAAPSYREAGEWIVDAKRVGSSAWMRTEAPSVVLASTRTTTTPFAIETPLFSEVTFLAAADRYLADHASVSFSGVDPASVRVHLTLRRARRISVEVTDPDGSPVSRAVFQYAVQRAGPSATLNPEIEFMVRDSLRTAFTGTSSPKTGAAVINQIVQSETDVNGMAAVTQPVNGAVEYLIVWADGFAPYVARRSMGAEQDDVVAVTLERVEARCRRYRLVRGGRPLRGAVLLLAEKLPDGFTPAMPSITADGDGFIPGSRVVADRTYSASVFDHSARKTYHGDLAFGSTEDVDLGSLAE